MVLVKKLPLFIIVSSETYIFVFENSSLKCCNTVNGCEFYVLPGNNGIDYQVFIFIYLLIIIKILHHEKFRNYCKSKKRRI